MTNAAMALSEAYGDAFTLLLVTVVLLAGLAFFALFLKGDVKAHFSLRPLEWTLDAKERTKKGPRARE